MGGVCPFDEDNPNRPDLCGTCGGDDFECCPDDCGTCFGDNEAKDRCGVCFGNGTSCDVDDEGDPLYYDDCGVCGGDNSTCSCVFFHGIHTDRLEWILLNYTLGNTLGKLNYSHYILNQTLALLETLDQDQFDLELAQQIFGIKEFCTDCLENYLAALCVFLDDLEGAIED